MLQNRTRTYVRYDRNTGEILGTYSRSTIHIPDPSDLVTPEAAAAAAEAAFAARPAEVNHGDIHEALGALPPHVNPEQVQILEVEAAPSVSRNGYWVDPQTQELKERFPLRLSTDRAAIDGDGQDSVEVVVTAPDTNGKPVSDYNADLKVTTSAGRLSASGGKVVMQNGVARIRLTSSAETKAQVTVAAQDLGKRFASGAVILEFL